MANLHHEQHLSQFLNGVLYRASQNVFPSLPPTSVRASCRSALLGTGIDTLFESAPLSLKS